MGKGPRDLDEVRIEVAHSGRGVDEDREDRAQEDDRDLGLDADPEPDDEERQQHDAWRRVEERDERVERIAEPLVPADEESRDDAEYERGGVAGDEMQCAAGQVLPDAMVMLLSVSS